ncbi:Sensor protein ZraS [compost metagenome]
MAKLAATETALTAALQDEQVALDAALVLVAEPASERWRVIGASSSNWSTHSDPVQLWADEGVDGAPRPGRVPAAVCNALGARPGYVWLGQLDAEEPLLAGVYWTDAPRASHAELAGFRARVTPAVLAEPRRLWGEAASELLARIVDDLPVGLVYFDDSAVSVAANRFARELLDLPASRCTPRVAAQGLARFGVASDDEGAGSPPGRSGRPDILVGDRRYSVSASPLQGAWGRGVVWRIEDVTDVRAAEARLNEAKRALLLSRVSGGIGHEFNNLLSRVICLAEEIQDSVDPQAVHDSAEALITTAEAGAEVVRRLMTYAGSRFQDLEAVRLDEALEIWSGTAGKEVRVGAVDCDVQVQTDRGLLIASLDELAKNARQSGATEIVVSCAADGDGTQIEVQIADNGRGMNATTLRHAMDPFYTTRAPGEGVGLGLSMVKGWLEQCGGRLDLSSQPGKGTIVTLRLPTSQSAAVDSMGR